MKFYTKSVTTIVTSVAIASILIPAFSQAATPVKGMKSESVNVSNSERSVVATTTIQRIEKTQEREASTVDARKAGIQALILRIQNMKNISDANRTSLITELQNDMTVLDSFKTKMSTTTSTSTSNQDASESLISTRIFALVVPKIQVLAAADRVGTVVSMMNAIGVKLESRIAGKSSLQSTLSDFKAKLADATTQANAATDIVTKLTSEIKDRGTLYANKTALQDARTKIQAAQQDLVAARKDIEIIKNNLKGITAPVESTSMASSTKK